MKQTGDNCLPSTSPGKHAYSAEEDSYDRDLNLESHSHDIRIVNLKVTDSTSREKKENRESQKFQKGQNVDEKFPAPV